MKILRDISNEIHVTLYLKPLIYADSFSGESVAAAVSFDSKSRKFHTDINPSRIINGPLSPKGELLESPISEEYESFISDCRFLIKECGFTIIDSERSDDSEKSEYILLFGIGDSPCGTLVFDLRLSDHPLDVTFPKKWKKLALEYLQTNKILDGSATEAGIDFIVEKVTVGSVTNDTWDRAFNRLYDRLKQIKNFIRVRNKERNN